MHLDDERLDAAIDEAARRMTAGEPRADFRRGVMARIEEGSGFRVQGSRFWVLGSGFRSWRPALAGLSVALLAVAALWLSRDLRRPERGVRPSTPVTEAPVAAAQPGSLPLQSQPPRPEVRLKPDTTYMTEPAATYASAPDIDPLSTPPIDVASIVVPRLPVESSIAPQPLQPIAPLTRRSTRKNRTIVVALWLATLTVAPAVAQQPAPQPQAPRGATPAQAPRVTPPAPAPQAAPSTPAPRRQGQPVNVKVDFTLTDQHPGGPPTKRTVTLIVADTMSGFIRSQSEVMGVRGNTVPLNIDASPELLPDGKIRLGFSVQYEWPAPIESGRDTNTAPRGTVLQTSMRESVSLILESGKAMVATQSADPIGDRQVTVEVKATILR